MATFSECLEALSTFRNVLQHHSMLETAEDKRSGFMMSTRFAALAPAASARTPLTNIHATGVGVRIRDGKIVPDEHVLKVYVFAKLTKSMPMPKSTPLSDLMRHFGKLPVDVEEMPVQLAHQTPPPNQQRNRPIPGGMQATPINQYYVGTLGCYVQREAEAEQQIFALSNNHVLANVNTLPIGTPIVQPGTAIGNATHADVFATLAAFVPIQFPTATDTAPPANEIDAAIAAVPDTSLIKLGTIEGIGQYKPVLATPVPHMRVVKSGRTTAVTHGTITGTHIQGVQVNYGSQSQPRIATFNNVIRIRGDQNNPFSSPGDSGSVILHQETWQPVALLFAGNGISTTACDMGAVCRAFGVVPA